ncbi:MAG: hypothetical protein AB1468_05840 [Candidatus Micrarchaeota archaeon]
MRKAQVGIEVVVVVGLILAVFIPIIFKLYNDLSSSSDTLNLLQARETAKKIANVADIVASAGYPSKVTITLYVPQNVESITLNANREIVFTMRTSSGRTEIVEMGGASLSGTLGTTPGARTITIAAVEGCARCASVSAS